MATPTTQIELEARQTVLDQIVAGASFTGYEITLEVRRRLGAGVDVPHPIVNTVVQTMFSRGEIIGYDRAPDTSVKAATPPFRYAPKAVAPRQSSPAAPAAVIGVNRRNLPINLRYSNPVAAVVREYALEARAFQDDAGKGDQPFDVWLPTTQNPTFRVRSFGAVPGEAEVQARYSLSPTSQTDFGSKAAYAYADEFRVSTFQNGTAKTFRCALDATGQGIVTKDGEVPTNQSDGVEIEVPVKANTSQISTNQFGREAAPVFARFRVPPSIKSGTLWNYQLPSTLFEGNGWRVVNSSNSLALVDDRAFPINMTLPLAGAFGRLPRPIGVELVLAPGEVEISGNGEALEYSDATRGVLKAGFERVERELPLLLTNHVASAPTIWEAKLRFSLLQSDMGELLRRFQTRFEWRGLEIQSALFDQLDAAEVTISGVTRRADGRLKTERSSILAAQENAVVFFNDLGNRTGSPTRLREFFAANPTVQRASVLTFSSDAAREKFIAQNQFETVPTLLLSSLPKTGGESVGRETPIEAGAVRSD